MLRKLKGLLVGLFLGFGGFALAQITIGLQGSQDPRLGLGLDGSRNFWMLQIPHVLTTPVTAPSASSCGTNPAVTGTDWNGEVSTGSGGSATCILTFNVTWGAAPRCIVIASTTSAAVLSWTTATTNLSVADVGSAASHKFTYLCTSSS